MQAGWAASVQYLSDNTAEELFPPLIWASKEIRSLGEAVLLLKIIIFSWWDQVFEQPNQRGFSMAWKNKKFSHARKVECKYCGVFQGKQHLVKEHRKKPKDRILKEKIPVALKEWK